MNPLFARFRAEQLDADIDIRLMQWSQQGSLLTIAGKTGDVRLVFFAVFGVPSAILFWNALTTPLLLVKILALAACPVLVVMACLMGFMGAEKSFDISRRLATKSVRFFGRRTEESETLPEQGVVKLTSRWETGGLESYWRYSVVVSPCAGFGFSTYRDYAAARGFAEKLAAFLSYPFEDAASPDSRK